MEADVDKEIEKGQISPKFRTAEEGLKWVKRIQGTKNRWEASMTMNYRVTFEFSENTLFFRTI